MDAVQSWQQLDTGIPGVYFRSFDIFERQRHGPATVYRQRYFRIFEDIPANFGRVEPGIPAVPTPVSFATFSQAAQQAGLSRIQGGIHFLDDITVGQDLGVLIGQQAWDKAQTYFNGTAQ